MSRLPFSRIPTSGIFECTSPSDSPALWIVFSLSHDNEVSFFGIFHDQRLAEDYAAKIENARVERVALRDTARAFDAKALIG